MTWHQSMEHIWPFLRLRCIGTERVQTQLHFHSILSNQIKRSCLDGCRNFGRKSSELFCKDGNKSVFYDDAQ